jgi:aminoglycoside phosphotransferase family enzyme/predicted kinase
MLIERLQNTQLYDHPVTAFEVLETHISWILLTGPYAYKLKKPVDLGFVDFTSLEKRRFYCEEELRLNRRLAPDLYLDVVAITGSTEKPAINGDRPPIEYAVKMRQFDQHGLLDKLAERDELQESHIDALAEQVAAFHRNIEVAAPHSHFGQPPQVNTWVDQNFEQMRPLLHDSEQLDQLDTLADWTRDWQQQHAERLAQRQQHGFTRECHGDMHLGNIALIDDEVTVFDCIDFNAELRWIDVMSEVAFLVMDLHDRGYPALAWRFLDRYLQHSGDYAGLAVLPYYLVYRALVRAKINLLRLQQNSDGDHPMSAARAAATLSEYRSYIELAQAFAHSPRPALLITHGLAASGKSTVASRLVAASGFIRIRSDVERKRLHDLAADMSSGSAVDAGIYTSDATQATYQCLAALAEQVLTAGYCVIIDATFLQRWQRALFEELARRRRLPLLILDVQAPYDLLRERIRARQARADDASEADLSVLQAQLQRYEALSDDEQAAAIVIDSTDVRIGNLLQAIERRCARYRP